MINISNIGFDSNKIICTLSFTEIYPFREGNGRIIRIFIRAFALSKGVQWEYENIDRDVYIQAMIQSVTNTEALKKLLLEKIVSSTNDHIQKNKHETKGWTRVALIFTTLKDFELVQCFLSVFWV